MSKKEIKVLDFKLLEKCLFSCCYVKAETEFLINLDRVFQTLGVTDLNHMFCVDEKPKLIKKKQKQHLLKYPCTCGDCTLSTQYANADRKANTEDL